MECVIWGVTQLGRYAAAHLEYKGMRIKPLAFVDNNLKIQGTNVDGIQVISYQQLLKKEYSDKITVLLALKNAKNIFQVFEQTENATFNRLGIINSNIMQMGVSVDPWQEKGEVIWRVLEGKKYRIIPRLEVNLIDACNLKCKACTHFSSIFQNGSIYPLEEYRKDLFQLRQIGQVFRLRLLGGEPLLLDNLDQYIEIARELLPESDIEIVTNGILFPKVDQKILTTIQSCRIRIVISPYHPTLKMKDQIAACLDAFKISWNMEGEKIEHFYRNLTLEKMHDAKISCANCLSATCTFLRKGRLYKCPVDGLTEEFCQYYRLQKIPDSGTDIYCDKETVYKAIVSYALKPIERCQYCVEEPEFILWSVESSPTLGDWLYGMKGDGYLPGISEKTDR